MKIKEKTQELAKAIKETDEYKNLKGAQSRLHLDPMAMNLVQKFQNHQQEAIQARQNGQQVNPETINAMSGLQGKMEQNPTIKNLINAQNSFETVMNQVNTTLSTELG